MGIAMTFARVPGPGDLRTLRRGPRGDDGVQGGERHRGYDACRRSRDVGGLQQKSGIAVYRNVEMVFPFVLWRLGHGNMKKKIKNKIIHDVIFFVIWFGALTIAMYLWHWWSDSLLSILGLPDHTVYFLIFAAPFLLLAHAVHKSVVKKFYRDEE